MIPLQTTPPQVLSAVLGFFQPFCSELAGQINGGDAKGWLGYLKEKDLLDESSSAVENDWLKLSVRITPFNKKAFGDALSPILKRLPMHHLPKIDSDTKVRHQGTDRILRTAITLVHLMAEGIGLIEKTGYWYRLTTNKWFGRYEVRDLMSLSDCNSGLCLNS